MINFPDLDQKFNLGYDKDWNFSTESDYNLVNPKSKGCFIVLWLYSIEPPLYYFVNEACRLRDKTVVPLLGPFLAAIAIILDGNAEGKRPDKREVG